MYVNTMSLLISCFVQYVPLQFNYIPISLIIFQLRCQKHYALSALRAQVYSKPRIHCKLFNRSESYSDTAIVIKTTVVGQRILEKSEVGVEGGDRRRGSDRR